MKINIKKLQDGGIIPTFSLPQVEIYPQNKFGDIARSQGLETARNWRKVKEGTTAGINEFANDPRTQFVQMMLPLPQGLEQIDKGVKLVSKPLKNYIFNKIFNYSLSNNNINKVNNLFRNKEWNNFLQTVNGDNYYRLQKDLNISAKNPNEKLFFSHTTPWQEFVGGNQLNTFVDTNGKLSNSFSDLSSNVNGNKILFEIPTKQIGNRLSSDSKGIFTNNFVSDLGKQHLKYGDTSSGVRDFVQIIPEKQAKNLNIDSKIIGIKDRPLKQTFNGELYDMTPKYENIHLGNQTFIPRQLFREVLNTSEYNTYEPTINGVQKIIHIK